jgi:chemotaxis regulatin CheY-phosphate phosphatase CheZ
MDITLMFQMIKKIMNMALKTEKAVILAIMRRVKNHAQAPVKKNARVRARIVIAKQNAQKIVAVNT